LALKALRFLAGISWSRVRTAPDTNHEKQFFTVTHLFHPLRDKRFELLDCKRTWGQWRVYYVTEDAQTASFPASWTDAGPKDPFVEQAQGRAIARVADLAAMVDLLQKIETRCVKENKPVV
jgi:hypothetical protein